MPKRDAEVVMFVVPIFVVIGAGWQWRSTCQSALKYRLPGSSSPNAVFLEAQGKLDPV